MLLPDFSLSITTGLDWLDGLPALDLDPSGRGSFFPSPLTPAFVHGDPRLEDRVPRKVSDPNHVVIVGDVLGVDASACPVHSNSPSAKVFQTHGQETMEPFADERKIFAKYANSQGG